MYLLGSQDIGPTRYLLALDKFLKETIWFSTPQTRHLLNEKQCIEKLDESKPELIVAGTSLGDTIDKKMINYAKQIGIPSVSIIDHWSWYKKRFELNNSTTFPDYIILNDEFAKEDAIADGIPLEKIFIGGNPHLEILAEKNPSTHFNANSWKEKYDFSQNRLLLFISEELKSTFLPDTDEYLGYNEFSVLDDLIQVLSENDFLFIKKHPEENQDKYNNYLSEKVLIIDDWDIEMMLQIPDFIIGMASMLLIELAIYRYDIISYRPNAQFPFIGEKLNATHLVNNKYELQMVLQNPPKYKKLSFRNNFYGSGERIANFLNNL